jgi:hypothetical protein
MLAGAEGLQEGGGQVAIASRTNGRKMEVNIKGPLGDSSKDFHLAARIQVPARCWYRSTWIGDLSVVGLEQAVEIDRGRRRRRPPPPKRQSARSTR